MSGSPELHGSDPTIPALHDVAGTMDVTDETALRGRRGVPSSERAKFWTFGEQEDFLDEALTQARGIEYAPRIVRGPHYAAFNSILQGIHRAMHDIDPALTPDSLTPASYQTQASSKYVRETPGVLGKIYALRRERLLQLKLQGGRGLLELMRQDLPNGLLDTPQYHRQGEHLDMAEANLLCVNACFRMVHDGIAGWAPPENLLAAMMKTEHGRTIVEDAEYYKLFQTDAFKRISDNRQVKVVEMLGADFATLNKLATAIKAGRPHARVFAVASLGSENASDEDTWHSVVLLHKNKDNEVLCHDPSTKTGRSYKHMPVIDFAHRWAITYNRALVTIVT